jgi:pre-mRNA-processing factor 39
MDHATGALQRAVVIYCKRRPEMHLFAAHFEERHGNVDSARRNFKYILAELSPRLLAAVTAAANFEARQNNEEAAWSYFEDLIREEKVKENSKIYCHLCIQYAHFLVQKYKRIEKAREALQDALEHSPNVRNLWEAAIYIEEIARSPDMAQRVLDLYNRCTETPSDPAKGLSVKDREELSQRSVDFADMYGDPMTTYEAEKAHSARFMLPTSITQPRKRPAGEPAGAMAAKAPRMDGSAAPLPPPPAAPPGPPAPAAAYYGQPPAAPPAAPAAAGYNYAAYYGQYQGYGYTGYGY